MKANVSIHVRNFQNDFSNFSSHPFSHFQTKDALDAEAGNTIYVFGQSPIFKNGWRFL
jgi:hypothetical protein